MTDGDASSVSDCALWSYRSKAERDEALLPLRATIEAGFGVLDANIRLLEQHLADSALARVTGLLAVKGKQLAFGCYSLSLDGLAQEAGALLRPLLEVIEMIAYVRATPEAIDKVLSEHPPAAGEIAAKVGSSFRGLRGHLNQYASHLTIGPASFRHLIVFHSDYSELRTTQVYSAAVLRKNAVMIGCFMIQLITECLLTYEVIGTYPPELVQKGESFRVAVLSWSDGLSPASTQA